jgi:hypothetical protein
MSLTGVPPVKKPKITAKMAVLHTGETPVLRGFVRVPKSLKEDRRVPWIAAFLSGNHARGPESAG